MWFLLNRFGIVLNFVVLEVDVRWVIGNSNLEYS